MRLLSIPRMSKEALMSTPQNRAIERERNNGLSLPQDHDRVLVERVLTGDQEAMIALFDRDSHLVYSFALRSTGTPELAETVLHEVFLRLWRTPGQCTPVPGSGIATWLKGCVQSNLASPSAPPARTLTNNPKMLEGTGLE